MPLTVLDMLMLVMLVILMLLDMLPTAHLPAPTSLVLLLLPSPLLPVDILVLGVMSPTLPELFMLPKNFKFEVVNVGICPYLNIFQFPAKKKKKKKKKVLFVYSTA